MATSDPIASVDFREGDVLAGKYRVERVLGAGGMGIVLAAHHVQLDTRVAIKVLRPAMLGDVDATTRFAREARAAVKIANEHVARVLDVGALPNGAPYIVMEFLEGEDLSVWLARRGPLPVERAVDFVLQTCVAVADAHGMGIVHRDLKPSNLFCVRRNDGHLVIKVLDFGISKLTGAGGAESGLSVTRTNTVMGSPLYMSPEQMRSAKDVDTRTDIWALGVIAFELLSGHVPFDGETFTEVAVKTTTAPPPSLRRLRSEVTPALEAVIEKCLEKDPRARYRNVSDFASALAEFGPRHGRAIADRIAGIAHASARGDARGQLPPVPHAASPIAETFSPAARTNAPPARWGRGAVLFVAGTLAVLSSAAIVLVGRVQYQASASGRAEASPAAEADAATKAAEAANGANGANVEPPSLELPPLTPLEPAFVASARPSPAHAPTAKAPPPPKTPPHAQSGGAPAVSEPPALSPSTPAPMVTATPQSPAVDPLSRLKVK